MKNVKPITQAAGAGLPWFEHWVIRFWVFPRLVKKLKGQGTRALWSREFELICAALESVPKNQWERKVLIPRVRGLEDSSRFWSLVQTLEHVDQVSRMMVAACRELLAGRIPGQLVSTADVKPKGSWALHEAWQNWQQLNADLSSSLLELCEQPESQCRYTHPWFGPLSSTQWLVLVSVHLRIHRIQVQQIARTILAEPLSSS